MIDATEQLEACRERLAHTKRIANLGETCEVFARLWRRFDEIGLLRRPLRE